MSVNLFQCHQDNCTYYETAVRVEAKVLEIKRSDIAQPALIEINSFDYGCLSIASRVLYVYL